MGSSIGSVGGLLGTAGGAGGSGFSTPSGTNSAQLLDAYNNSQAAMTGQQGLLSALQAQNGLQNQSNVYNQLQGVVNGQGPNPAQAQLSQATGANVANQAALMAGQRGAAGNVGLMARQAAMQGANTQQQAAGQAATLQAQQSLNALTGAGGMADTQASNQIGQTNANVASAQNEQSVLQGANTANNAIQGQLAGTAMQGQQGLIGGVMNGAGAAMGLAGGGEVQKFASGGSAFGGKSKFAQTLNGSGANAAGPFNMAQGAGAQSLQQGMSSLGQGIGNTLNPMKAVNAGLPAAQQQFNNQLVQPGQTSQSPMSASSDNSGIDTSAPTESITQGDTQYAAKGGNIGSKLKGGGHVPGQAKVRGNSYSNDTVKALLSPGEVVIPKSVMESKDPVRGSAEFVRAIMAKKRIKA